MPRPPRFKISLYQISKITDLLTFYNIPICYSPKYTTKLLQVLLIFVHPLQEFLKCLTVMHTDAESVFSIRPCEEV
jgi:hypothetical protein